MRWAFSSATNRLVVVAIVALVLNIYFRARYGFEDSYVEQLKRWFGFDNLVRALDHRY